MKLLGKIIAAYFKTFWESIFSIALILFFSKWKVKRPQLQNGVRKQCIILGNGPSLSSQIDQVRSLRSNYSILCVNDFPRSELFSEIKPEYFTLLDPYYWAGEGSKIPDTTITLFNEIARKSNWSICLLLPYEMKMFIKEWRTIIPNMNLSYYYFNRTPVSGYKPLMYKLFDYNLGIPFAQNVLVSSVYLMLWMSFEKILIFGADHSWHEKIIVSKENILCVKQDHFQYEKDGESVYDDEGNYNPVYKFSGDNKLVAETFKIHELFNAWAKAFEAYWILKDYSVYKKCTIINLSNKSYIDAFDRHFK